MIKREIPKRNYLILFVIMTLVICLTLYMVEWHKTIKEYYQNNSIIAEVLPKIESETISSYLLDNSEVVIYISSSKDQEIKSFEQKFKKYITGNDLDLNDNIVYFDTIDLEQEYINNLFIKYTGTTFKKMKKIVVPNLIYFSNGEIVDILYVKENEITISNVKSFMKRNGVITND